MSLSVDRSIIPAGNIVSAFQDAEHAYAVNKETTTTSAAVIIPQGTGIRSSQQAISLLDQQQNTPRYAYQSDQKQHNAIAAYQSVQNEQKRADIQSMFGVDLYA